MIFAEHCQMTDGHWRATVVGDKGHLWSEVLG
jgi:hypothetical protein